MRDSLTLKIGMIGLLTLLLLFPLGVIRGKISERQNYQATVRQEIAASWSDSQTLLAPVLVQPYTVAVRNETGSESERQTSLVTEQKIRILTLPNLHVRAALATEQRRRGIYSVPVYNTSLDIQGRVNMQELQAVREELAQLPGFQTLGKPYLALALDEQRGISGAPEMIFNDQTLPLLSGSGIPGWAAGLRAEVPEPESTDLPLALADPDRFTLTLNLRGMESLLVAPIARAATVSITSPWPHPDFIGAFLPESRDIGKNGFSARWSVNEYNNLVGAHLRQCEAGNCGELRATGLGVNLFEPVNVYTLAERASKYGILFIGLSFAAFFAMEITRKLRIHPIQYAFAGLALALFFLLLISLSEHISFAIAYCIAAASCIAVLGLYLRHILQGRPGALLFSVALSGIYAVIYSTLQAEDYAFLMGSVLTFAVLVALMAATRNINWYQLRPAASLP